MCVSIYKYIYIFIYLFVSLRRDPAPAPLNLRDCSRRPVDKFTGNTGPSRGTGYYLAVTPVWCPADLRTVFVRNRSFIPGVETPSASLAEAMDTLWHRIDSTFQWENKILDRCGATNTPHTDSSVRSVTFGYLYIIYMCVYIYIYVYIYMFI